MSNLSYNSCISLGGDLTVSPIWRSGRILSGSSNLERGERHVGLFHGAQMNYRRIYDQLMERARGRELDEYTEKHHRLPICLGGGNQDTNLVSLTPEEHYVAHQLLVKMYPSHQGITFAGISMISTPPQYKGRSTNKMYGWLRRAHAKAIRGSRNPMSNPDHRETHSKVMKSKEFRELQSKLQSGENNAMFGKPCTWKALGLPHPMLGKHQSKEAKDKISKAMIGRVFSEETLRKLSVSVKQSIKRRKEK